MGAGVQINGHLKFNHMAEDPQLHVLITTRAPCKAVCSTGKEKQTRKKGCS